MPFTTILSVLVTAALGQGAVDPPKATRVVDGQKLAFDPKGVPAGVKVALDLLESCHSVYRPDRKPPTAESLTKALEGDHVRVMFAKPITANVMGKKVEVTELVVSSTFGAIWLRSGPVVLAYTKYEPLKWNAFLKCFRELAPAK